MTHDQIKDLLLDFSEGTLSSAENGVVAEHIRECMECREQLFLIRFLEKSVSSDPSFFFPHPSSAEIFEFAIGGDGLDAEESELIDRHVSECDQCREFVEFARQVDSLPDEANVRRHDPPLPGFNRKLERMAMAAVLLLMLYPAYLGLKSPTSGLQPFVAGESALVFRDRTLSDRIPDLVLNRKKPYFQLTIFSKHFSGESYPDDPVRVVVAATKGDDPVLDLETTYSRLISEEQPSVINIVIPTQGRRPGEYLVRLENLGRPGVSYSARFHIVE